MDRPIVPDYAGEPRALSGRELLWLALAVVFAGVAGLACVIVPAFVVPPGIQRTYPAPLFPTLTAALENLALGPTALGLFALGMVLGAALPRFWLILGWAPVVPLPLATFCEAIVSPTSHNLWPVEMVVYAFVGLPGFIGAAIGGALNGWAAARAGGGGGVSR